MMEIEGEMLEEEEDDDEEEEEEAEEEARFIGVILKTVLEE
jgi:hypothetical protein